MQRPIRPDWLLRQADELAGRGAGSGQPRNADLRRAVSAAYYALFHALVGAAVEHVLPGCSNDDRFRMARHYQHAAIKRVCTWVVPPTTPPERVRAAMLKVRSDTDLLDIADAFIQLQEARHEADYDHLADFSRPGSLALIDMSWDACDKLNASIGTPSSELFLAHVTMASKVDS